MNENQRSLNDTVKLDGTDDVMEKESFGWLFSTVTAFGLLLFLTLSFIFYHRRLATKRRNDEEYNNYFQMFRPELAYSDKRISRARSMLTNTHGVKMSHSLTNENGCYNEAFEYENMADTSRKMSYTDWIERRNSSTNDLHLGVYGDEAESNLTINSFKHHSQRNKDNKKQIIIDREQMDIFDPITNIDTSSKTESSMIKPLVRNNQNRFESMRTKCDVGKLKSSALHMGETAKEKLDTHNHVVEQLNRENNEMQENAPLFPRMNLNLTGSRRKKKRGLLKRMKQKQGLSLDENISFVPPVYNVPRRQSESGLYLYDREAADPKDSALLRTQSRVLFNPYYTDIGLPVGLNCLPKRSITDADHVQGLDMLNNSYELHRKMSLSDKKEVDKRHISYSTWM